nr:hypothetical protein [Tanacetum cinerariifolium]
ALSSSSLNLNQQHYPTALTRTSSTHPENEDDTSDFKPEENHADEDAKPKQEDNDDDIDCGKVEAPSKRKRFGKDGSLRL